MSIFKHSKYIEGVPTFPFWNDDTVPLTIDLLNPKSVGFDMMSSTTIAPSFKPYTHTIPHTHLSPRLSCYKRRVYLSRILLNAPLTPPTLYLESCSLLNSLSTITCEAVF